MALIKTINTTIGPASYWIVGLIQIDNFNKTAYCRLYGFFNKDYADLNAPKPVITLEYNITSEIFNWYFSKEIMSQNEVTPQTQAYQVFKDITLLSETGEEYNFHNAIDDIQEVAEDGLQSNSMER